MSAKALLLLLGHIRSVKHALSADLELIDFQISLRDSEVPTEVSSMMIESFEATLKSGIATEEERGEAAWALAQLIIRDQPEKFRELCLTAGLFGNEHARVNYLYRGIRNSEAITLDTKVHVDWLVQSLTGPFVFKTLKFCPSSNLQQELRNGLSAGLGKSEAKHEIMALTERFVRDVCGEDHAPHHQVLRDGKWMTIASARERTFEKFRQGIEPIREDLPPYVLHETAVCGTGDVVRDLICTQNIDIDRKSRTDYHPGPATALQLAFLRHNDDTVKALVDLGADVLPLFSTDTLEAFLIEGDRTNLHWLNHLIPLMKEENAAEARKRYDSILLSHRALQRAIVQSNWSL
jgi:hypothetical protein